MLLFLLFICLNAWTAFNLNRKIWLENKTSEHEFFFLLFLHTFCGLVIPKLFKSHITWLNIFILTGCFAWIRLHWAPFSRSPATELKLRMHNICYVQTPLIGVDVFAKSALIQPSEKPVVILFWCKRVLPRWYNDTRTGSAAKNRHLLALHLLSWHSVCIQVRIRIHEMRRVAISCAILIIFHILFNFQFQFCVGRTEDDPPKNKSPQVSVNDIEIIWNILNVRINSIVCSKRYWTVYLKCLKATQA